MCSGSCSYDPSFDHPRRHSPAVHTCAQVAAHSTAASIIFAALGSSISIHSPAVHHFRLWHSLWHSEWL